MSDFNNNDLNEEMLVEEGVKMNGFQKAIGIIVSPKKTLEAISTKPTILIPMFIIFIIPLLYGVIFWEQIKPDMIIALEEQMEVQGVELTRELMDIQLTATQYTLYFSGAAVWLFSLVTALYYFICSRIAGVDPKYKAILSVIYHVGIITSLATVLTIILTALGIDTGLTNVTSLAIVLPASMAGGVLHTILSTINIFSIWALIVTAMGLQIVGKMSKRASVISVVVAYLFNLLISVGAVLLNQIMSGLV